MKNLVKEKIFEIIENEYYNGLFKDSDQSRIFFEEFANECAQEILNYITMPHIINIIENQFIDTGKLGGTQIYQADYNRKLIQGFYDPGLKSFSLTVNSLFVIGLNCKDAKSLEFALFRNVKC